MRHIKAFGAFWYDFVVGDDWRVALGVVSALVLTYAISRSAAPAWWVVPVATVLILAFSLMRALRSD